MTRPSGVHAFSSAEGCLTIWSSAASEASPLQRRVRRHDPLEMPRRLLEVAFLVRVPGDEGGESAGSSGRLVGSSLGGWFQRTATDLPETHSFLVLFAMLDTVPEELRRTVWMNREWFSGDAWLRIEGASTTGFLVLFAIMHTAPEELRRTVWMTREGPAGTRGSG